MQTPELLALVDRARQLSAQLTTINRAFSEAFETMNKTALEAALQAADVMGYKAGPVVKARAVVRKIDLVCELAKEAKWSCARDVRPWNTYPDLDLKHLSYRQDISHPSMEA